MENRRVRSRGMEVNTMAILDASGFNKGSQDLTDDRITFLEAVRSASIVSETGIAPTKKMFQAIFHIFKDDDSLELIMASYHLLHELDKHFPRVFLPKAEASESASPSNIHQLVVVEEAWSPLMLGSDNERGDAKGGTRESLDSSGFHRLIQQLIEVADGSVVEGLETKSLRNMLLLQYLVNVLEGDFVPRETLYKENKDWVLLRESLLNMLLGSRRIIYKGLIKDCLTIMCAMSREISHEKGSPEEPTAELLKCRDSAAAISCPELKRSTCVALQKFLIMAMKLDISKREADAYGLTTRVDGSRIPVLEIIQDELTYNDDTLRPFFQVFNEPKWKLDIIMQYFRKYISKPSVRTRQASDTVDDSTFAGILKCFSNSSSAKSSIKKIGSEVAHLLIAHAFQAYLLLSSQDSAGGNGSNGVIEGCTLIEVCENLVSAFTNLRTIDKHAEISPFGKGALFTAGCVLSKNRGTKRKTTS